MEDFDSYESADSGTNTASSGLEVSEKFKEGVKKAGAKAKKIQKDEKKAKKYDIMLSSFLIKIILDKRYDDLLALIMACLDKGYPSNFLLGVFSLVYIDISKKIRESSNKKIFDFKYSSKEPIEFNDTVINEKIRDRINLWVEDMIDVVLIEGSEITTKKLVDLLDNEKKVIDEYFVGVFVFFFKSMNITIFENKAFNYTDFISGELKKSYRNYYFSIKIEEEEI
ncbi:hypothetical protein EOM39_04710 [Candidatus Gracilibacteria bacterium]|nr:hypothetical protein [Candidatus Gracilibacteria bacterium]